MHGTLRFRRWWGLAGIWAWGLVMGVAMIWLAACSAPDEPDGEEVDDVEARLQLGGGTLGVGGEPGVAGGEPGLAAPLSGGLSEPPEGADRYREYQSRGREMAAAGAGAEEVLRVYETLETTHEAEAFFSGLVPVWVGHSPGECLAFLERLPPTDAKMRWLGEALALSALGDPEGTAARLETILRPEQNPIAYARVASAWAAEDPEQALDWARSLAGGDQQGMILGMALTTWTQRDPAAALTYLSGADWVENRVADSAIRVAAVALANEDGPAAAQWALAQQAEGGEGAPLEMVFSTWAARAPGDAAAYAIGNLPASETESALVAVAQGWAMSDPAAAKSWVSGLPAGTPGIDRIRDAVESTALRQSEMPEAPASVQFPPMQP